MLGGTRAIDKQRDRHADSDRNSFNETKHKDMFASRAHVSSVNTQYNATNNTNDFWRTIAEWMKVACVRALWYSHYGLFK